jgi:hypothetical protein
MDQFAPVKKLTKNLKYSDFTDGGSTAGTYTFTGSDGLFPPNSIVLGWSADVVTGFTGDTSCTMQIGDAGGAGDYSTTTSGSVYTSLTRIGSFTVVASAHTGSDAIGALVTLTSNADFTSITAGEMNVNIYYLAM